MGRTGEEIRIRYLYRSLILRGKVVLSLEAARGLIGPDCAYHLYSLMGGKKAGKDAKRVLQKSKCKMQIAKLRYGLRP